MQENGITGHQRKTLWQTVIGNRFGQIKVILVKHVQYDIHHCRWTDIGLIYLDNVLIGAIAGLIDGATEYLSTCFFDDDTPTDKLGGIVGEKLNLRTYRKPKEVTSTTYKIDEIHGVNKAVVDLPEHKHIDDHYIEDEISEDIMRRNQMTFEYKYDDNGELVPNIQPDGMITTLVNFPDPVEVLKNEWSETLKKHPSTESEIEPTETPH